MVLNQDIHEFDDMETKENIFKRIYKWFVGDEKEYQRLVQELNYWKLRSSRYEKRYKRLLRKVRDEKKKESE